tara:strand:- start:717 stop:920 length:204 start_codon:yes stop_codon:yes gene_type:complete
MISFNPYTVMSPIWLENLAKNILKDLSGIIALGMFTMARVPNPIINSRIIKINVIKPIMLDLMNFIF